MGICESNRRHSDRVKIDGVIKNLSFDFLFEGSIKSPITEKYKLEETKIYHNSFNQIVIGTDESGKKYAIKIIKKKAILMGQLLANEVRLGTMINHPNILGVKEVYEDLKNISVVMDYCEGGDLFDYIIKNPEEKLDDLKSIDILIQILNTLDYLHNQLKICHRDIKPENFLITFDEQNRPILKLIDFGMAHDIKRGGKMKGKIGTIMFMAPEIIMDKPYDEKVDLWSTGVILYNMTTGCEPFSQGYEDFKRIEMQIVNRPINFDKIKNDDLRKLCQEMLERNPDKRLDARTALEKAIIIKKNFNNEN